MFQKKTMVLGLILSVSYSSLSFASESQNKCKVVLGSLKIDSHKSAADFQVEMLRIVRVHADGVKLSSDKNPLNHIRSSGEISPIQFEFLKEIELFHQYRLKHETEYVLKQQYQLVEDLHSIVVKNKSGQSLIDNVNEFQVIALRHLRFRMMGKGNFHSLDNIHISLLAQIKNLDQLSRYNQALNLGYFDKAFILVSPFYADAGFSKLAVTESFQWIIDGERNLSFLPLDLLEFQDTRYKLPPLQKHGLVFGEFAKQVIQALAEIHQLTETAGRAHQYQLRDSLIPGYKDNKVKESQAAIKKLPQAFIKLSQLVENIEENSQYSKAQIENLSSILKHQISESAISEYNANLLINMLQAAAKNL